MTDDRAFSARDCFKTRGVRRVPTLGCGSAWRSQEPSVVRLSRRLLVAPARPATTENEEQG